MKFSTIIAAGLVGCVGLAGCGDSLGGSAGSVGVRSFVVDRQYVETITHQGTGYQVQDITFEYADGRRETRRYVLIGMRRIGCGGDSCQDALERGLANADEGDDDY